jgi:hypothetical protein
MNVMTKIWPRPKFRFLAIQLSYQLMTLKRNILQTSYSHITIFEQVPKESK